MKKLLLFAIGAGLSLGAFAQRTTNIHGQQGKITGNYDIQHGYNAAARTTAVGDTFALTHIQSTDTITLYHVGNNADSGYVIGTDVYGDMGFAERYDLDSLDSTEKVIGVVSLFGGTINPASTKTITYNVWSVGPQTAITGATNVFYSGLPSAALTSLNEPITHLGIALNDTAQDTIKDFLFPTPTAYLRKSFFIGYNINYTFAALAGDTIGLYSNQVGDRTSVEYTLSGVDTIINDVNATMYSDGTWHDDAIDNFDVLNNLYIFPIVKIGIGTESVHGITNNNFTFFGNYPNPAVNSTNIKFSLAKATDVTVIITDLNGRAVNTISQPNLGVGEHLITVATNNMAPGNYIYVIRTTSGDGIASTMTVVK